MQNFRFKAVLVYNFIIPALLLNCVGIVILKLINSYGVTVNAASWLESFKDFSILISSFIFTSYMPKIGYRLSLIIGTILYILASLLMALHPSYLSSSLFFIFVGTGFAFSKVGIYSSIGLFTKDSKEHASMLSILEGFFMLGILGGYWLFGLFMDLHHWTITFWLTAGLSASGLLSLIFTPFDEEKLAKSTKSHPSHYGMLGLFNMLKKWAIWAFFILVFSYLFIEQGAINWVPTYNNHILHISSAVSVEIASLLSGCLALGRFVFGSVMQKIHWSKVLIFCLICSGLVLAIAVYYSLPYLNSTQTFDSWKTLPWVAYLFPLIGFFVAPIYPILCSSIISSQPIESQSVVTVWIVIFSAIGGAVGARVLGVLFGMGRYGGIYAMSMLVIPILILLVFILPYYFLLRKIELKSA